MTKGSMFQMRVTGSRPRLKSSMKSLSKIEPNLKKMKYFQKL